MKQFIIGALVVVAIIAGAVVLGKDKEVTGSASNYVYGKADSKVVLLEFGDFECPACSVYYPIVEQVKEKYKDKIAFQFRHFPLVQVHQNALAAHRAAEAAGKQGKFWEMYSLLYENQEEWNGPSSSDNVGVTTAQAITMFEGYAGAIGLNVDQYKKELNDPTTLATINTDTAAAKSEFNASGTPTFVLNGKKIEDTSTIDTVDELSALIDKALEEANKK